MSMKYSKPEDVPTEVLIQRLMELSIAVSAGRDSVKRELTISVPVEMDRDPDVVLHEAARRLQGYIKPGGKTPEDK